MVLYFNRPTPTLCPRAIELLAFAAEEGINLPLSTDLIIWLEDHGCVVDLRSGKATHPHVGRPTPSGKAVSHLLTPAEIEADTDAYEDDIADRQFWAWGQW